MKHVSLSLVSGALIASLCGCAASPPPGSPSPQPVPSAALLTTAVPVTVIDDGRGALACLGGVAESLPPRCSGPGLIGWDWDAHAGAYDEVAGVRWGDFVLTGTYDADAVSFTPTTAIAAADPELSAPDAGEPVTGGSATPCAQPSGGWHVVDPSRTTPEDEASAMELAQRLDGFAEAWNDRSRSPVYGTTPGPDDVSAQDALMDPTYAILNVATAGDPSEAERRIREVWGGMLCVSPADRSLAELEGIRGEIDDELDPVFHTNGYIDADAGVVGVGVVVDDGTLQQAYDERYGDDVVRVESALVPVGPLRGAAP